LLLGLLFLLALVVLVSANAAVLLQLELMHVILVQALKVNLKIALGREAIATHFATEGSLTCV
jgi:hypothetical protein